MCWKGLLLKEQVCDCARFQKFDDLLDICDVESSLKDLLIEVLGDMLSGMVAPLNKRGQAARMGEALRVCADKLSQCHVLPPSCQLDLQRLHQALTSPAECEDSSLGMSVSAYYGILKPLFDNCSWPPLFEEWSRLQVKNKPGEVRQLYQNWASCPQDLQKAKDLEAALLAASKLESSRADVALVLNGLKLSAEQNVAKMQKLLLEVSKGLRENAVLNFAEVTDHFESGISWPVEKLAGQDGLSEVCAELSQVQTKMQMFMELGQLLVRLGQGLRVEANKDGCQPGDRATESAETNRGSDGSACQAVSGADSKVNANVVSTWTSVKSLLQTNAWPHPITQELSELLDRTRHEEASNALLLSSQQKWQEILSSLVTLALSSGPEEEFKSAVSKLESEEHAALQVCALSSTPVFDRSVINFSAQQVAEVCKRIHVAKSGCQPGVNRAVLEHLEACQTEEGKLKLEKVLTQKEQLQLFLNVAKDYCSEWRAQFEEKEKEALAEVAESQKKLNDMLLPLGDGTLQDWLKKAETGDMLKKELKRLSKAEKLLTTLGSDPTTDAGNMEALKTKVKAQIVMWGCVSLLCKQDIASANGAGDKIRQALKDIWDANSKDTGIREQLPEALTLEVEKALQPPVEEEGRGTNCSKRPNNPGAQTAAKKKRKAEK